jgi:hypothetical protein
VFVVGSRCVGEEAKVVQIPLSEIWALDMPGTKNVYNLDQSRMELPMSTLSTGPLQLLHLLKINEARPGFVVIGTGQEALIASHKKLPEGESPPSVFLPGKELSIVYFSHGFARRIVLNRVLRRGFDIEISCRFQPTGDEVCSSHFALIPLGTLPVGKYQVSVSDQGNDVLSQFPAEEVAALRDRMHRSVCKSFQFEIVDTQATDASSRKHDSQE